MKKIMTFLLLATSMITYADRYHAPSLKLKRSAHAYKIKKEKTYKQLKEHSYKIQEKPERKRNLASEKRGRIPSSKDKAYQDFKVEPWALIKLQ